MAAPRLNKQWLQKQFQSSGIQAEPAALARLVEVLNEIEEPEQFLHSLLDELVTNVDERKVTLAILESMLGHFTGSGGAGGFLQVIDASQVPLITYDPVRKLFHQSNQHRSIFADAQSKTKLYVDRFLLILQRLRRHALFRPVQWGILGAGRSESSAELTELKALLGLVGQRRYIAGFLTRQDEDRYFIEDLSARLPLDIKSSDTTDGLFVENCVVVAEGELTPGGHFRATALGLPPPESRADSLSALQGLDFFGGMRPEARAVERWAATQGEDRVVIMSDVHLDRPEVLERLHLILGGFSDMEAPPSTFVLMGDFQSYDANAGASSFSRVRENFATLGRIISQYPSLKESKFLIVPGPGDVGPANVLPRPPLPRALTSKLLDAAPNAQLCSNPCRVRHGPKELVLFRSNLQRKMRGLCIVPPSAGDADAQGDGEGAPDFHHLCATVLQESHLCPVPLEFQPVSWEHDHALWLYPQPHALVLADAEPAARYTFDSCACLNPGSLLDGTFGCWKPTTDDMELCDVSPEAAGDEAEDEEEEEDAVEVEEEREREGGEEEEEVLEVMDMEAGGSGSEQDGDEELLA